MTSTIEETEVSTPLAPSDNRPADLTDFAVNPIGDGQHFIDLAFYAEGFGDLDLAVQQRWVAALHRFTWAGSHRAAGRWDDGHFLNSQRQVNPIDPVPGGGDEVPAFMRPVLQRISTEVYAHSAETHLSISNIIVESALIPRLAEVGVNVNPGQREALVYGMRNFLVWLQGRDDVSRAWTRFRDYTRNYWYEFAEENSRPEYRALRPLIVGSRTDGIPIVQPALDGALTDPHSDWTATLESMDAPALRAHLQEAYGYFAQKAQERNLCGEFDQITAKMGWPRRTPRRDVRVQGSYSKVYTRREILASMGVSEAEGLPERVLSRAPFDVYVSMAIPASAGRYAIGRYAEAAVNGGWAALLGRALSVPPESLTDIEVTSIRV